MLNPNFTQYDCNCRIREDCPLQNQCLTPNIIYRAYVCCEVKKDLFRDSTNSFKRNRNRDFKQKYWIQSLKAQSYPNKSGLLKDAGTPYTIYWSIVSKRKGSRNINYCPLCLPKKYRLFECFNIIDLLNRKSEFINACSHQQVNYYLKLLKKMIAWIDRILRKLAEKYFCIFVNLM